MRCTGVIESLVFLSIYILFASRWFWTPKWHWQRINCTHICRIIMLPNAHPKLLWSVTDINLQMLNLWSEHIYLDTYIHISVYISEVSDFGWLSVAGFTSTETVGLLGTGAQDGHLDFNTATELWSLMPYYNSIRYNNRLLLFFTPCLSIDHYQHCKFSPGSRV